MPDILKWEVKWALGSIIMNKACGGYAIPTKLFQILKDDAVKVLHMPANLENSSVATGLATGQFSLQSQRRTMPKNVQATVQSCSFHMLTMLCSKSFKLGFSSA